LRGGVDSGFRFWVNKFVEKCFVPSLQRDAALAQSFTESEGRFTYEKLVRDDFATASFSGTKKSSRRRASRRLDPPRFFADTAVRARKNDVHPLHGNDAFPTGRGSHHRGWKEARAPRPHA